MSLDCVTSYQYFIVSLCCGCSFLQILNEIGKNCLKDDQSINASKACFGMAKIQACDYRKQMSELVCLSIRYLKEHNPRIF